MSKDFFVGLVFLLALGAMVVVSVLVRGFSSQEVLSNLQVKFEQIAGLKIGEPVRVRGIIKSALKYFPAFKESDFEGVPPWRGLRPCSPDGLPYIGRTTKFANLSIATGHAMMGLSLGPITGRLMAQVLSGEPPQFDLSLLSPDRYA